MVKSKVFMSGIILFSLLTIIACVKKREMAIIGSTAPDFTLTDLDGRKVSLSDYKGKVILLDFWATWCPPCRDSIPHLENLYQRNKEKGLVIIGISYDEDIKALKEFMESFRMTYPILMGEEWLRNDYGITGLPEMFVIDRNGILKSHHIGFNESLAAILEEEIKGLL